VAWLTAKLLHGLKVDAAQFATFSGQPPAFSGQRSAASGQIANESENSV
jgi:hypothetical protein